MVIKRIFHIFVAIYLANNCLTDGKPTSGGCDHPADIVFVLDSSSSIHPNDFGKQLTFVNNLVEDFNIGPGATQTRVGVMTFAERARLKFSLNKYTEKKSLQRAIQGIRYVPGYKTMTDKAIDFLTSTMFTSLRGSRPDVDHMAIIITDGKSTISEKTKAAAATARAAGIQVYAIGVGPKFDLTELRDIASDPDDQYVYTVGGYHALESIIDELDVRKCEETTTTAAPTTTTTPTTTTPTTTTTTTTEATTTTEPLQKDTFQCNGEPMDLYFLMDSSGSIGWRNYKIQKEFVKDLINDFSMNQTDTRVGLVIFSEKYRHSIPLGSMNDKAEIISAIDNLPYLRRGTNTADALKFIREEAFAAGQTRPEAQRVLILLTDGLSRDQVDTRYQATQARESGIKIFAIGIGKGADKKELRDIASQPEKKYVVFVNDFEDLKSNDIKDTIATRTCIKMTTPVPEPTTSTAAPSTAEITTHAPVTVESIQQDIDNFACSGKPMDLYFLMDSSGSIGWTNYKIQKEFVKDLISDFSENQNGTRVGLVIFSEKYNLSIPLGSISNKAQVLASIDNLPYLRRGTNTGAALKFVREEAFSNNLGRPGAQKVLILLTDGLSRDPVDTRLQATLARESGITIFAIGIGRGADKKELRDIANQPETKYVLFVDDFEDLKSNDIKDAIATRTCIKKVSDQPPASTCSPSPSGMLDVVFVYDAFSLGARISMEITHFIASIIQTWDMTSGNIRVGRLVTDCPENGNLALSSQRLPSIINIRYPGISNLLVNLRTTAFSLANGGRLGARRAAVIFMDSDDSNIQNSLSEIASLNDMQIFVLLVGQQKHLGSFSIGYHTLFNVMSYQQLPQFQVPFLRKFCSKIAQPNGNAP